MTILEEMYENDLFSIIETEEMGEAYKNALNILLNAEKAITDKYPDCKAIIEEYQAAEIDLHHITHRHEFCKGFRAGAQIMIEIFKPAG